MNRTDRLFALVDVLRSRAPATVTIGELAGRFEVSRRTIERDLLALLEAGVPIWSTRGRGGGYGVDESMTLPPLDFTFDEAAALAVALRAHGDFALPTAGESALRKIVSALAPETREAMRRMLGRIRVSDEVGASPSVRSAVERAITDERVLVIDYRDVSGARTHGRTVEPAGLLSTPSGWYLIGWCRLRQGARFFRLDRIESARVTEEAVSPRDLRGDLGIDLDDSRVPDA